MPPTLFLTTRYRLESEMLQEHLQLNTTGIQIELVHVGSTALQLTTMNSFELAEDSLLLVLENQFSYSSLTDLTNQLSFLSSSVKNLKIIFQWQRNLNILLNLIHLPRVYQSQNLQELTELVMFFMLPHQDEYTCSL